MAITIVIIQVFVCILAAVFITLGIAFGILEDGCLKTEIYEEIEYIRLNMKKCNIFGKIVFLCILIFFLPFTVAYYPMRFIASFIRRSIPKIKNLKKLGLKKEYR